MKKMVIYSFLILCCGILLACSNQKVLDEKDQSTTPNKEEAVKAYIYAKNIELWESVFVSAKRYNEVAGKKICNDEEVELCRKVGKKICTYYFKESEVIEGELLKDEVVQYYSSLKYNIEKKTWETKFGREETNDIEKLTILILIFQRQKYRSIRKRFWQKSRNIWKSIQAQFERRENIKYLLKIFPK